MMSARLISVPADGSGSPLTGRNVLQFPGRFLLENGDSHLTAEELHGQAVTSGISVSLATVYTEEMMVIGRVGVEIRAPRLTHRLNTAGVAHDAPGFG